MTLIILIIYIALMAILTLFVVRPIAYNKSKKEVRKRHPEDRVKARKIAKKAKNKVLFYWYLGIIVVGVIIGIVGFVLESTIFTEYTLPSIIQNIINRKENNEEDDTYHWGFDDYYEIDESGNKVYYTSEAELFMQIVKEECDYYSSNNIRGGQRYWDWYNSLDGRYLKPPWNWCAGFVQYCSFKTGMYGINGTLGILSKGLTLSCGDLVYKIKSGALGGTYHYYSKSKGGYFDSNGTAVDYIPQPGDFAVYSSSGGASFPHVGVVEYTDNSGSVHTIGGNEGGSVAGPGIFCQKSVVKRNNRGIGACNGYNYVLFFTPDWKMSQVDNNESLGDFNLSSYTKDSTGYYSGDTLFQIVYDFLRIKCGYNSAAATGVVANMASESIRYDQMEAANFGIAYENKSKTSKSHKVPSTYGNGNYVGIEGIETLMWNPGVLYYEKSNHSGFAKYGMGFGLFQWSFGRRVAMFNYSEENGYGKGYGQDSFAGQLAYLMYEVQTNYESVNNYLLNVPDTAQGAYDAAYYWHEKFEISAGGRSESVKRGNLARDTYWPKYGGTNPSVTISDEKTGESTTSEIGNATIIGDSNTVRMYSYGTTIASARKILATVGVGVNSYDSFVTSASGRTTIPNKTIKSAINSCSYTDLNHVVIMLGTNDYGTNSEVFKNKYNELLSVIEGKNSTSNVTICTIPPVKDSASGTIKDSDATRVSNLIKEVVNEYGGSLTVKLLDINSKLSPSDMSIASGDGYHLSSYGATKCAKYIATSLG